MYSYEVCMDSEANSEAIADAETEEANIEGEEMEMLGPDEICCGVFRTNYYWWNDFLEKYICPEVERRKNPNPEPICDATQLDDETMVIATEAIATQELIDLYLEEGFFYREVSAFGAPFIGDYEMYENAANEMCPGTDPVDTGYTRIEIDPMCDDLINIQEAHELANIELGILLSKKECLLEALTVSCDAVNNAW